MQNTADSNKILATDSSHADKFAKKDAQVISLTNISQLDKVLDGLKSSKSNQQQYQQYFNSNFNSLAGGGKADYLAVRTKKKAKNVTPLGQKPYCRHKEFEKMPKHSLEAPCVRISSAFSGSEIQ